MRDLIAQWADWMGTAATVFLICSMTVQYAAEGSAIKAALASPFAVISLVLVGVHYAERFGYI